MRGISTGTGCLGWLDYDLVIGACNPDGTICRAEYGPFPGVAVRATGAQDWDRPIAILNGVSDVSAVNPAQVTAERDRICQGMDALLDGDASLASDRVWIRGDPPRPFRFVLLCGEPARRLTRALYNPDPYGNEDEDRYPVNPRLLECVGDGDRQTCGLQSEGNRGLVLDLVRGPDGRFRILMFYESFMEPDDMPSERERRRYEREALTRSCP